MTDAKVVDASALAALLFDEPEAASVARKLQGGTLLAPTLLGFELANVCLMKIRRHPQFQAEFLAAFRARENLRIETVEVDQTETIALAQQTGLTAYDASYLWLAHETRAGLVTLDKQLAAAASAIDGA